MIAAIFGLTAAVPRPVNPSNITVYHVNPHAEGAIPFNMNTGDATGDLFFDLFEVVIVPLACQQNTTGGHSCSNPEAVGADLMVNKLTLEVDNQYSGYARCNIGINGSDGRGHTCKTGSYCCFCGSYYPESCNDTLGREDLYDHMGQGPEAAAATWAEPPDEKRHYGCNEKSQPVECYTSNARKKLSKLHPGYWYSSLASGYCGASGSCTWRVVSVDKIVTRSCHSRVFGEVVQKTAGPGCLDGCGDQKTNTSAPCWVDCFYKAALGPDAGKAGGQVAGMPVADLIAAWEKPFEPEDEGGCPAQPERQSWFAPARQVAI